MKEKVIKNKKEEVDLLAKMPWLRNAGEAVGAGVISMGAAMALKPLGLEMSLERIGTIGLVVSVASLLGQDIVGRVKRVPEVKVGYHGNCLGNGKWNSSYEVQKEISDVLIGVEYLVECPVCRRMVEGVNIRERFRLFQR